MRINFIGNFQNNVVKEIGDANHLARELEELGHEVQRVQQDIWKAWLDGEDNPEWHEHLPLEKADINIVCKWHYFNDKKYYQELKKRTGAPIFYWVWDYMNNEGFPDWHILNIEQADLYLGNDVRDPAYPKRLRKKLYYFPFDVADGQFSRYQSQKEYDVVFFGTYLGQGDRIKWLKEINKTTPVTVFAFNYQDWQREGFNAKPVVYGEEFNRTVSLSKIVLGFSVEPNCWGYWSNRVGKVLLAGGFLLYQYAPGMELFLRDGAEYFSTIEEAREKIDHYLIADEERETIAQRGREIGQRFSSKARVKDLTILIERWLINHNGWKF